MEVLHACWLGASAGAVGRIGVWAEDSAKPAAAPAGRGRPPRLRDHPYALDRDVLRARLPAAVDATAHDLGLRLPTRAGGPLPSPELIRETLPPETGALRTADWRIPALAIDIDDALRLIGGIPVPGGIGADGPSAASELRSFDALGASVRHLLDLADFAADLVRRGRLLPTLLTDPPAAVWRPVLTGRDAAWTRVLAAASPPALLAAGGDRTAWADLLDALVDAGARVLLGRHSLSVGPRSERAAVGAWLAGLSGRERSLDLAPAEAAELEAQLADWQRDALGGDVRACFRLAEPAAEADEWQLQLGLQDVEEPTSVVDATAIWTSRGDALPGLGRPLDAPQETFLAELGKAARLYPALDRALRVARPDVLVLDTGGAHDFLRDAAPTLSTAGFGVQLPGWWSNPASRLGLKITASTPSQPGMVEVGSALGANALAGFRYDLAVGDAVLTAEELAELTAAKSPLVRLRGQWIELDAKRLAAGLRFAGRTEQASIGDLLRLGLGTAVDDDELPVTELAADGWLGELLSGDAVRRLEPVEPPVSFTGTLRPYQARGLSWLDFLDRAGLGGVLADDMGLGKTVQLLALLSADLGRPAGAEPRPSLLICPMSLVGNWQREAARFTPELRVHVHHGAERARGKAFTAAVEASDLVITTYALAARDAAALRAVGWRRVVVDEAQAIKNAATKQSTAIRSIPARTRIAVTGTPVENRLADLWSILEFANPGLLGTATGFKKRYAEPIERHGDDEAAERLRTYTAPFMLRRVKTDSSIISDLPDKLEMDVVCNLTAEQAALYQAVVDDMVDKIEKSEGIERRGLVLATMTKLKQVCNHPSQFLRDGGRLPGRSGKLERLDEILTEVLAADERALLFTQYAEFGAMLRGHLSARFGREVLFLHGGVGKPARDKLVARFQSDDRWAPPLFVLSLKAGGTGLTLTAANHVVHVDRWWNPAVEDQATDRAFRIGQRRSVQVRKFVCAGTVEEKVAAMINTKRGLAAKIVGTGEQWLTELSTDDLAALLRLETGAVVE
ncbi:DEAD/DEAH box helicase [Microlunatus ginsengisoli]|uniref:DEAD/DEAH box helicase n=1 Tax=Microlunatus ginsengisoli TaxID=363863 RepID=A0ABP7A8U0_9ACTN